MVNKIGIRSLQAIEVDSKILSVEDGGSFPIGRLIAHGASRFLNSLFTFACLPGPGESSLFLCQLYD